MSKNHHLTFPSDQMAAMNGILDAVVEGRAVGSTALATAMPVVDALQAIIDDPNPRRGTTIITEEGGRR